MWKMLTRSCKALPKTLQTPFWKEGIEKLLLPLRSVKACFDLWPKLKMIEERFGQPMLIKPL